MEAFSQFGSDLDEATMSQLVKGKNLYEVLKQRQYSPLSLERQVIILYLAINNKFFSFDKEDIKPFFNLFFDYITSLYPEVIDTISKTGDFTDEIKDLIDKGFEEYYQLWINEHEDYGADI